MLVELNSRIPVLIFVNRSVLFLKASRNIFNNEEKNHAKFSTCRHGEEITFYWLSHGAALILILFNCFP
jgi:hypothetical protein